MEVEIGNAREWTKRDEERSKTVRERGEEGGQGKARQREASDRE